MATNKKDPVLVVLQLSGGNDYMNTVVPYTDGIYHDNRKAVAFKENQVLPIDGGVGLNPAMGLLKDMYDQGNMAIIHGIGYPDSPRSHFRSMDIWHTCEPETLGTEGWLGLATRDIDPNKENIVTTVSFGPSLFRALVLPGVPVACVDNLESYGLLTGITGQQQREQILDRFSRMYAPEMGNDIVTEYLGQTGLEAMKGADILKVAPESYSSSIEYADTTIAKKLRGISQIHQAGLGTRIFYCDHGSFDSHAKQPDMHATLWTDVSQALDDFYADLREHDAADNVIVLMFSEFGRRVRHRPRRCRRGVRNRRRRQGWSVRRVPVHEARGPPAGRPSPQHGLPGPLHHCIRGLAGSGRQAHSQREFRSAPVSLTRQTHP